MNKNEKPKMDVEKKRGRERVGAEGRKNKVSWPGSGRDFCLCGSHTPTRAGALLCVPARSHPLDAATRPHSLWMISRINLGRWWKGCELSQRSSLFIPGGAPKRCSGCVGGGGGLFVGVNVLCCTGRVSAGVISSQTCLLKVQLLNSLLNAAANPIPS